MTFPNIPNVTPSISLSRSSVVNLLLASVAFEELGLAHIINAEAEKIQAAVGTLPASPLVVGTIPELIAINESVNRTLKTVLKKEMLLQFKLEDIMDIPACQIAVIAREVTETLPGQSIERFFGTAGGASQVTVEILSGNTVQSSATAQVGANGQFEATLSVPAGLPPEFQPFIRVTSVDDPNCTFLQPVSAIPSL